MRSFFSLSEFKPRTANYYFVAKLHKLTDHFLQVERLWPSLDNGYIIDTIRSLKICMFVKLVDDKIGYPIPFQINYNACAFLIVRFIVYMSNSLDHLIVYQDTNAIGKFIAVYLVRNLGDNNLFTTTWLRIYI